MQALLLMVLAAAGDGPAAMALKAGEGATVRQGKGPSRPLRDGDMVPEGASVVAGKEEVLLFLHKGGGVQVKPGATALVGPDGCAPASSVVALKRRGISAAQLSAIQRLMGERGGVGIIRRGPPEGLSGQGISPLHTASVASVRSSFRWAAVPDAELYEVRFMSGEEGSYEKAWKEHARTTRPSLEYPKGESSVTHGLSRTWAVYVKRKGKDGLELLVSPSWFVVLEEDAMKDAADIKTLADGKDSSDWLLAAVAYEALGMYGEAKEQYLRVDKARPGQVEVLRALEHFHRLARDKERADGAKARRIKITGEKK